MSEDLVHDGANPPSQCPVCAVPVDGHDDLFAHGAVFHPDQTHSFYASGMVVNAVVSMGEDGVSTAVMLEVFVRSGPEDEDFEWLKLAMPPSMAVWMASLIPAVAAAAGEPL